MENKIRLGINPLLLALGVCGATGCAAQEAASRPVLLHAARVFDGHDMKTDTSVLVSGGQVQQIGPRASFDEQIQAQAIDLGDATLLPGFIELHAHLAFQHIPADTVLRHGITTIRDVGGPVHPPYGGDGSLRVLTSGLIITAPGGYPIPGMGADNIATPVASEAQARETVRRMIDGGAAVIKVALEPGGEAGSPWAAGHGHGHHGLPHAAHGSPRHDQSPAAHENAHHSAHDAPAHHADPAQPALPRLSQDHDITSVKDWFSVHDAPAKQAWPLLPENIVKAIVDEAHQQGRKVTAHLAEEQGVRIALSAGIDEWAHMPCDAIPEALLKKAAAQNVKIVTTLDTLSKCAGIAHNASTWAALGGEFLYGAEVAHPDIPWGIDAQELMALSSMANMQPIDVLRTATSKAGRHLNEPLLGTLQAGAPADMIAVKGDPTQSFKILEHPDLVMSGGKIIVNYFEN